MTHICLYFQVHQPYRLRKYTYFDVGNHDYVDDHKNRDILLKVAHKCYLPTNKILLKLIKKHRGKFKIAFSLSGIIIEQLKQFSPETLESFQRLVDTGCVEILNETYYHSLSFIFSRKEFLRQVEMHKKLITDTFGYKATTFRNTELIYNNELAMLIAQQKYTAILAEGADKFLQWRCPNYVYNPPGVPNLKLLLKNYRLSDDIAFRFSNRHWVEHPLTADKFARWVHEHYQHPVINLFMDYETFGEHQWKDTGIFNFLEHMPEKLLQHWDFGFATPHEVAKKVKPICELDVPYFTSWADEERDLTAWNGNILQQESLTQIYALEQAILRKNNNKLIKDWRLLQTSDHFYYMCTKYDNDGDVHKYFNPYTNPYDAYINYQNILRDLKARADDVE